MTIKSFLNRVKNNFYKVKFKNYIIDFKKILIKKIFDSS